MTALYDAIYLAVQKVRHGRNPKKAVLLITDGEDNRSHYTFANVRDLITESDVQIYAIGILGNGWVHRVSNFGFPDVGRAAIQDLAEIGGGQAFFPRSLDELENIASRIAVELKNQYVLGYVSTNQKKDGKWRKIRVMVNPPAELSHLIIRAKRGYFARTE
jgi:Ca-activated chloride channel family protein